MKLLDGILMHAPPLQLDTMLHDMAVPGSAHLQLAQLLLQAMSVVDEDVTEAVACIRRASSLAREGGQRSAGPAAPARRGLVPWQAERVRKHIETNFTSRVTIDDLAQITGLSTSHFSLSFRETFGAPPHDYICRRRVEQAKRLMSGSDTPLCEIALDCGFADQSHLSRVFRRVTGSTPAAWRRNRQRFAEAAGSTPPAP